MTAVATAPAPAEEPGKPICGQRHPQIAGSVCTRDLGHRGGHKNPSHYWQATETAR